MAVGRRGVFFTLMALLLITFIYLSQPFAARTAQPLLDDASAVRERISVLNLYLSSVEKHAANSLRLAGYLSLQNLSARVRTSGNFITDMNASVRYCLLNYSSPFNCILPNQTINTTLDRLVSIGRTNLTIDTKYAVLDVWVTEEQPMELVFWMNLSLNISDPYATWRTYRTIRAPVDVTGIEDPLFGRWVRNGNLSKGRVFNLTPYKTFQFDNTTFTTFYIQEQYLYLPIGRSVLQRYTGDLARNSTCCGLETVIKIADVNANSVYMARPQYVNWSFVDWEFYLRNDPAHVYDCATSKSAALDGDDVPAAWLRMDSYHIFNIYKINGSRNVTCCHPNASASPGMCP